MPTLNIKGFPEDLDRVLAQRAEKNRRSLTAEVIYLLEWALDASEEKKGSILQVRGLGKKLWKEVDLTKHIDAERESWA